MPWKLLFYLVVLSVVVLFAGVNIRNVSDVSVGFHTFEDIPIFVSLFAAFFLGVLVTLPFTYVKYLRKRAKFPKQKKEKKPRKRRFSRKQLAETTAPPAEE